MPKISDFEQKQAVDIDQNDFLVVENTQDNKNYQINVNDLQSLEGSSTSFATVAAMVASTEITVGDLVFTQGYTSAGDGGHGVYRIVAAATGYDDGGLYHDLTGITGQAELVHNGRFSVKQFGAVGDGVTDDTAAMNAAVGNELLYPNTSLPTQYTLELGANDTYLMKAWLRVRTTRNPTIIGNNATIKRAAAQTSTLTATVAENATELTVADIGALNVSVGENLILINTGAANGGVADGEQGDNTLKVQSINGNTITTTAPIELDVNGDLDGAGEWPIGATVLKVFSQVNNGGDAPLKIYDTIFDGNRANNTVHHGWTVNNCMSNIGYRSIVQNCVFHSMANECIFAGYWATITGNTAYDLNGSFVHISAGQTEADDDHACCLISNNRMRDVCEVGRDISTHSEGGITFSSQSGKVVIADNILDGSGQGFCGNAGNVGEIVITGNLARKCEGVFALNPNAELLKGVTISGNTFNTCGALIIHAANSQTRVEQNEGAQSINITGNNFINCRVKFDNVSHFAFTGNTLVWEDGYAPGASDFTIGSESIDAAVYQLGLYECLRYVIEGNVFEDLGATVNEIDTAIFYEIESSPVKIKTDASTESDYLYFNRDSIIARNVIANYANGIGNDRALRGLTYSLQGLLIAGNMVSLKDVSGSEYGIRSAPGAVVSGNTVICTSNTEDGIYVRGVNDSVKTALNGDVIVGNVVIGNPSSSIAVGLGTGNQDNIDRSWNMTVANNITDVAVEDNNPTQNVVSGNIQNKVTSTSYPLQATRANSGWY